MTAEVSRTTVIILVVVAIVVSVISTSLVINTVYNTAAPFSETKSAPSAHAVLVVDNRQEGASVSIKVE